MEGNQQDGPGDQEEGLWTTGVQVYEGAAGMGVEKGGDGEGAHIKQYFITSKMTMRQKILLTRKP